MGESAVVNQDAIIDSLGDSVGFSDVPLYVDSEGVGVKTPEQAQPAETQPAPAAQPAPVQETAPAQQEAQEPQATPAESTPEPFSFIGENGFNANEAIDFLSKGQPEQKSQLSEMLNPQPEPQQPAIQQPAAEAQPSEQDVLRQNYLNSITYAENYVNQGYSAQDAMKLAKQDAERDLDKYFQDRRFQEMEDKFNGRETELQKQKELLDIKPKADANLYEMSKNYGGMDKFQKFLFTPKYGGNAFYNDFVRSNPDKANLRGDDLNSALNSHLTTIAADKNRLSELTSIAYGNLVRESLPHITKMVNQNATEQVTKNIQNINLGVGNAQKPIANNDISPQMQSLNEYLQPTIDRIN